MKIFETTSENEAFFMDVSNHYSILVKRIYDKTIITVKQDESLITTESSDAVSTVADMVRDSIYQDNFSLIFNSKKDNLK